MTLLLWSCRAQEHKPLWSSESGNRGVPCGEPALPRMGRSVGDRARLLSVVQEESVGGAHPQLSGGHVSACPSAPRGRGRVQNGVFQHLSRPRITPDTPGPSGWSFKTSNWISFMCNPVTSQTAAFALVPRMSLCVRAPQQEYLRSPQHPGSHWFQSWMFWGPRLTGVGPRVGAPDVGHRQTLRSSGRDSACEIPPCCVGVLVRLCLCLSRGKRWVQGLHVSPSWSKGCKWFLFSSNG